jgi:hypothetical protein
VTRHAARLRIPRHRFVAPATIIATAILAPPLLGQVGIEPGSGHSLHLELARPSLDQPGLFPGLSAWTADAALVVSPSERVAIFARIGLVRATVEGNPSSTTVSHPRLGVVARAVSWLDAEAHVDLGLMQEVGDLHYATTVAHYLDYERVERYWPDAWSVGASLVPWKDLGDGFVAGARLGGTVISSATDLDGETLLTYAGFVRFPISTTEWTASLSGIALVSEEDLGFHARTVHFGLLSISAAEVPGRPGLFIRAPVDTNLDRVLNWVVGAQARIGF